MPSKKIIILAIFGILFASGVGFMFGFKRNVVFSESVLGSLKNSDSHISTSMSKDFYEDFFKYTVETSSESERTYSGVIPHHLLAGRYLARFFNQLKEQNPEIVVLIGPNHFQAGRNALTSSKYSWKTPYGNIEPNTEIINKLIAKNIIAIDENILDKEFSVGALTPFIKRTWKNAMIIPIVVKNNASPEMLKKLAEELSLILPKKSIVLASVDFSHYITKEAANFHDELSQNILETADLNRVWNLEVDSPASLFFLLSYNQIKKAEKFNLVFHTNSAEIVSRPDLAETTSHISGYYTDGEPSSKKKITMQFFGDIMLDRNVAKAMGTQGLDYLLKNLRGQENRFLWGMDYLIANLEGPFAPGRVKTSKSIAFRFDPKLATQLKSYGFTAFDLANNHSYDMGRANVVFTRETLDKAGLGYFGDELNEGQVYTYVTGTVAFIGLHNTYHELNWDKVKQSIDDARAKAEYVVVNIHWGDEYKRISNNKQREAGHRLIDMGADAIIGHHPHVIQEVEIYKDKPIFYSLGNFIFDQYFSEETQEGYSVGLTLEEGKVKSIYLFPFYGVKSQVQVMQGDRREKFLKWMGENSKLDGRKIENGVIDIKK